MHVVMGILTRLAHLRMPTKMSRRTKMFPLWCTPHVCENVPGLEPRHPWVGIPEQQAGVKSHARVWEHHKLDGFQIF